MPLFRLRTRTYEAVLFEGVVHHPDGRQDVLFSESGRLPKWLRGALIDGDLQVVASASHLVLGLGDDGVHVHAGDYIMYEAGMGIVVVSSSDLLEDFEPVPAVRDSTVQVTGVEAFGEAFSVMGIPV